MGATLFPSIEYRQLRLNKPMEAYGARQALSQLTIYDSTTCVFQTVFGVKSGDLKNEAEFKIIYNHLIGIMNDDSAGLYSGLHDVIGQSARFSWSCAIDLIGLSDAHLNDSAPNGIVGPYVDSDSARTLDSDKLAIKVGPTGSYCYVPEKSLSELNNVIFWLGHAHYSFAVLHETVRNLVAKQSALSKTRQLAPNQFHKFVESKIGILNTLSLIEPQVSGSRWVDFEIYDHIYRQWEISHLKNICLELLDRLESIVSGLEDVRIRRNNFALSVLINVITFTSLFSVLSYFWDFTRRQEAKLGIFGVSQESFLSIEPIGVLGIAAIALLFSFAALLRNR